MNVCRGTLSVMTSTEPVPRVAHRAGNNAALLEAAIAHGADLLETDVYTWRGRLEIRHGRRIGPLPWLWEEPWSFLRDERRVLADLTRRLPARAQLMLDLKGWQPWLGGGVRDAMEQAAPGAPYTVCSRTWRTLDAFAGLDHIRVVHSVGSRGELARLPARLDRTPTWAICVRSDLLTQARAAALRRRAEVLMSWPIDTAAAYDQVVGLGVNAVVSNDLSALPRTPGTRVREVG